MPNTDSTPSSPRAVTVRVGSASSELFEAPLPGPDHQVLHRGVEGVEVEAVGVVDRRGDEAPAAQGDGQAQVDGARGAEGVALVEAVERGVLDEGAGHRAEEEADHQALLVEAPGGVLGV